MPRSRGEKLTAEQRELRNAQILKLFIAGYNQSDIARALDTTPETVSVNLKEALKTTAEHREILNNQALSVYVTRLETLIQAAWAKVDAGDLKAIEVARRLLEQQAKLYGLHDPVARTPIPPMSDNELATGVDADVEPEDELQAYRNRHKATGTK